MERRASASNDLEKATQTAKQMVMRYGMSERLGPRVFGHDRGQPFLSRDMGSEPDYSDEIAREIDDEIRRVVEAAASEEDVFGARDEEEETPEPESQPESQGPRAGAAMAKDQADRVPREPRLRP